MFQEFDYFLDKIHGSSGSLPSSPASKDNGFDPAPGDEVPEDIRAFFGHPLADDEMEGDGTDGHASALALLHEYQSLPSIDKADLKLGDKHDALSELLKSDFERAMEIGMGSDNLSVLDLEAFLNKTSDNLDQGVPMPRLSSSLETTTDDSSGDSILAPDTIYNKMDLPDISSFTENELDLNLNTKSKPFDSFESNPLEDTLDYMNGKSVSSSNYDSLLSQSITAQVPKSQPHLTPKSTRKSKSTSSVPKTNSDHKGHSASLDLHNPMFIAQQVTQALQRVQAMHMAAVQNPALQKQVLKLAEQKRSNRQIAKGCIENKSNSQTVSFGSNAQPLCENGVSMPESINIVAPQTSIYGTKHSKTATVLKVPPPPLHIIRSASTSTTMSTASLVPSRSSNMSQVHCSTQPSTPINAQNGAQPGNDIPPMAVPAQHIPSQTDLQVPMPVSTASYPQLSPTSSSFVVPPMFVTPDNHIVYQTASGHVRVPFPLPSVPPGVPFVPPPGVPLPPHLRMMYPLPEVQVTAPQNTSTTTTYPAPPLSPSTHPSAQAKLSHPVTSSASSSPVRKHPSTEALPKLTKMGSLKDHNSNGSVSNFSGTPLTVSTHSQSTFTSSSNSSVASSPTTPNYSLTPNQPFPAIITNPKIDMSSTGLMNLDPIASTLENQTPSLPQPPPYNAFHLRPPPPLIPLHRPQPPQQLQLNICSAPTTPSPTEEKPKASKKKKKQPLTKSKPTTYNIEKETAPKPKKKKKSTKGNKNTTAPTLTLKDACEMLKDSLDDCNGDSDIFSNNVPVSNMGSNVANGHVSCPATPESIHERLNSAPTTPCTSQSITLNNISSVPDTFPATTLQTGIPSNTTISSSTSSYLPTDNIPDDELAQYMNNNNPQSCANTSTFNRSPPKLVHDPVLSEASFTNRGPSPEATHIKSESDGIGPAINPQVLIIKPQTPPAFPQQAYGDLKSPDSGFNETCVSPAEVTGILHNHLQNTPENSRGKVSKRRRSSTGKHVQHSTPSKLSSISFIHKLDPMLSPFMYTMDTPISTSQKIEEDKITYLNKGQFYSLNLEYKAKDRPLNSNTVRSLIMVVFRDNKSVEDEVKAWEFWHARQHNSKQRILDVDMKNSTGICMSAIEEVAFNAIAVRWNPQEQSAKVNVAVNCLSTDFSNQKGVKGSPLHFQVDTYDDGIVSRGYCQVKVFCDKGAERKTRDEERRRETRTKSQDGESEKFHPPCDKTDFYIMADFSRTPVLFQPAPEHEAITSSQIDAQMYGNLSFGGDEGPIAKRCRPTSFVVEQESQKVLLYVREDHEAIYTALMVHTPTVDALAKAIEEKYQIEAASIRNIFKKSMKGILVRMDDNIIKHYSNESTFIIDIAKTSEDTPTGNPYYDVTLAEVDSAPGQ